MRSEETFEERIENMLDCLDSVLIKISIYQHRQTELLERLVELNQPKKRTPTTKVVIPTVGEISDYVKEINAGIDPNGFFDYYTARGWKLKGGDPVKDWKACVRTWMRNGFNKAPKQDNDKTGAVL